MKLGRSLALAGLAAAALGASTLAVDAMNDRSTGRHHSWVPGAAPGTTFTAVVTANGTLKRGFGAVSASQPEGRGTYEVVFTANVTACAYVVTVGEPDNSGQQPAAAATVVGRFDDAAAIFVNTLDKHGNRKNFPFHVDVAC